MSWLAILGTALVAMLLAAPALRRASMAGGARDGDLFRTQLADLEADIASGRIAPDQAGSLKAELQRRLLRAERQARPAASLGAERRWPVIALAGLCMAAGLSLYLLRGNPGLPSSPAAPLPAADAPTIEQYQGAEARLTENPGDIPAWIALSDAMGRMGRTEAAVEALTVAGRAMPESPDLWVARGEALVRHAGGQVTPAARHAFNEASRIAPDHPAPLFYLALAWMQAGQPDEALAALERLEAISRPDAPWMERVRRMMRGARTMKAAGIGTVNGK